MKKPSFNLSRRRQRAIVFASVAAFATAAVGLPGLVQPSASANITSNPNSQPYSCGTGGTDDSYRTTLRLTSSVGSNSSFSGSITPCISGVEYEMNLPQPSSGYAASINGSAKSSSTISVKMANGSSPSNLYQLSFGNFTISTTANAPTLKTIAGAAAAGSQAPYTFSITPDPAGGSNTPPVIGGQNVITDMVVDGSSTIDVYLPPGVALLGCNIAGGTLGGGLAGTHCVMTVASMSSTMVGLLNFLGFTTLDLYSLDLKFYYLVTHNSSGGAPSTAAISFPRTTIQVTPAS